MSDDKRFTINLKRLARLTAVLAPILVYAAPPPASKLPEGPGKATVERLCTACHGAEVIPLRKRTRDRWERVVDTMVDRGLSISDKDRAVVMTYLVTQIGAERAGKTQQKQK